MFDFSMPGMYGLVFIKQARQVYDEIKYFILIGYVIINQIQKALDQNSIEGYFQKSFDLQEIEKRMKEAVEE